MIHLNEVINFANAQLVASGWSLAAPKQRPSMIGAQEKALIGWFESWAYFIAGKLFKWSMWSMNDRKNSL